MPTFDYASLASDARALLVEFGQTLQLRRLSGGTYDPVTGATSGSVTTTNTDVQALALNIDAAYREEVGADNVQADDRLFLLPDTLVPLLSDSLVIASAPWSIVRVKEINPGGVALLYKVQVRR